MKEYKLEFIITWGTGIQGKVVLLLDGEFDHYLAIVRGTQILRDVLSPKVDILGVTIEVKPT